MQEVPFALQASNIATFKLNPDEWGRFKEFFITNGKGILTKKEIDITARPSNPKRFGHAVVLTSFNSEYLRLLDSRGSDWADNGFIKVQNADVLGFQFYDVYCTTDVNLVSIWVKISIFEIFAQ